MKRSELSDNEIFMDLPKNKVLDLTVHEHEGSIAVSFVLEIRAPEDALNAVISDWMRRLADWVTDRGGIIGHLKASLESPGTVKMYSITDRELTVRQQQAAARKINVVAIVFLVEREALIQQMLNMKRVLLALESQ